MNIKKLAMVVCALTMAAGQLGAKEITMKITERYLNIPVAQEVSRKRMTLMVDGEEVRSFVIRVPTYAPDYYVFVDMSEYLGKTLTISYDATGRDCRGMDKIYLSDEIDGQASMYKEENRPQLHFTTRRGWINDPNGLVYYDGEYHLFYQHNPFEREWENMTWGHAVSKDLVHWTELPSALFPDKLGTMFSGSAVIDYKNTAGWNQGDTPAMVIAYTVAAPDRQTQCIAYSLDKGRTFTKYEGNPVIDSKEKWNTVDTRDPKVIWYEPNNEWVMVLNEGGGHSIYTSSDLKEWKYQSHINGFWECPDLFELPVDGDENNKKWVMYDAPGAYMVGSFDGKQFVPESGKQHYMSGTLYAAQTYSNIPDSDGRRIQIGWSRVTHPGMPFKGQMGLPTELTLHSTKDGIRLFNKPVKEIDKLQSRKFVSKKNLSADKGNNALQKYSDEATLRIKLTMTLSDAAESGLRLYGQDILRYDPKAHTVNGVAYSPENMTISADIIVDKTTFEVFIDGGAYSFYWERKPDANNKDGFRFYGDDLQIKNLDVYKMNSIWE